jgi:hypothetical protein
MLMGLVGAMVLSASAGTSNVPGVALGSVVLLVAERTAVLFGIWMAMVVMVVRTFRNQLPIEISGRGIRYAESDEVQGKVLSTGEALGDLDAEMAWIREAILDLQEADARRSHAAAVVD